MISCVDFEHPETKKVNWEAYRKAQIAAGEKCTQCGGFILPGKGYPTKCAPCAQLESSPEEVQHHKEARCPACGETFDVFEHNQETEGNLLHDGDHEVSCPNCDHNFNITTVVDWTFRSPARIQNQEHES